MPPEDLARAAQTYDLSSVAFTYTEPLVAYEYVRDAAALTRSLGMKNVLVTAGYVNAAPLRELCRSVDAVTLDLKAFEEPLFRELAGGRVAPVLRALEVFREEGVWVEVSSLMVPTLSDAPASIGAFAAWVVRTLGRDTPFHLLRFHPDHRLRTLPPTPVASMQEARRRCQDAGLRFVYLGNVPGHDANHTRCPRCGRVVIERQGYAVTKSALGAGRCPCGEPIAGVF
jgi:pyruvate formate lyase activating enzyme